MPKEDLRKEGLKNGLRQLTSEQLQRVLDYQDEMVLDEFNYQDGKFCPLAIALELDKKFTNPTHNIIFDELSKMGYKVYNTRGVKGNFYTDKRKEDLIQATKEVLSERDFLYKDESFNFAQRAFQENLSSSLEEQLKFAMEISKGSINPNKTRAHLLYLRNK